MQPKEGSLPASNDWQPVGPEGSAAEIAAEAQRGYRHYVEGFVRKEGLPEGDAASVAAKVLSATEREGAGLPAGVEEEPTRVTVQLPTAAEWELALHPIAIKPAPTGMASTGVDPRWHYAPTHWPGEEMTAEPREQHEQARQPPMLRREKIICDTVWKSEEPSCIFIFAS
jgi:hypothetical protein